MGVREHTRERALSSGAGERNLRCAGGVDGVGVWDRDLDFPQPCLSGGKEPPAFQMLGLTPRVAKVQANL